MAEIIELKIPYGIDSEGQLESAKKAIKGKDYFCPVCFEKIILRKGKIKRPHFAHKANTKCSQESVIHKTAKLLIQKVIRDWKAGVNNPPVLLRQCGGCGQFKEQKLPEKVEDAVLEYRLKEGVIVDVGLVVNETVQSAVEVKITHEVDDEKLKKMSIPFIEVDGNAIIENPYVWKSLKDTFKPFVCKKCKEIFVKFQKKAQMTAQKCNIELPKNYYRYGITTCWKCKREIIVFAWPRDELHSKNEPKVKPYPKTIKYYYSRTINAKYWVNTCSYCGAIQGDYYLYMEPDGPFFGAHIRKDSLKAFREDMLHIAFYMDYCGLL